MVWLVGTSHWTSFPILLGGLDDEVLAADGVHDNRWPSSARPGLEQCNLVSVACHHSSETVLGVVPVCPQRMTRLKSKSTRVEAQISDIAWDWQEGNYPPRRAADVMVWWLSYGTPLASGEAVLPPNGIPVCPSNKFSLEALATAIGAIPVYKFAYEDDRLFSISLQQSKVS